MEEEGEEGLEVLDECDDDPSKDIKLCAAIDIEGLRTFGLLISLFTPTKVYAVVVVSWSGAAPTSLRPKGKEDPWLMGEDGE